MNTICSLLVSVTWSHCIFIFHNISYPLFSIAQFGSCSYHFSTHSRSAVPRNFQCTNLATWSWCLLLYSRWAILLRSLTVWLTVSPISEQILSILLLLAVLVLSPFFFLLLLLFSSSLSLLFFLSLLSLLSYILHINNREGLQNFQHCYLTN